jgi:hypothetical protein
MTDPSSSFSTYLHFDGNSDYVEIPNSTGLSVATTGVLTVSAWIMPEVLTFPKTTRGGYMHWLGKGEGSGAGGQQEWTFRMYNLENDVNRPNRISFYVFNSAGHLGVGAYFEDPADPVVAGVWMHFAGVADNGAITIYKNGVDTGHCFQYQGVGNCPNQLDSAGNPIIINPLGGSAPMRIGTQDGKTFFQGGIAKVRVWSRALNDTEVANLYQSDTLPGDSLAAEYLLNEGTGSVAFDTSSGNNPGTINGATWVTAGKTTF